MDEYNAQGDVEMVTIKQVAERAGVAPSTVSRILNDSTTYASAKTREKVLQSARELNYVPNANAQRLRSNRMHSIALIIADITNTAYPPIIQGIEACARKQGYNVILCITNDDLEIEKYYIDKLKNDCVDGFIVCSSIPQSRGIYQLKAEGIPLVLVARSVEDEFNAVVVDNYNGAYNAVKYLINTGKRSIAIISGDTRITLYKERLKGYKDALRNAGLEVRDEMILFDRGNSNALYRTLRTLLEEHETDAIFATTDVRAIIASKVISDLGLRVPKDISIIGFDNIDISKMVTPSLSTVSQPFYEMGALAAQRLIEKIEHGDTQKSAVEVDVMKTELILRESTD